MDRLLKAVEAHLRKTGEKPSMFGRRAVDDPALVLTLRRGRRVWPETEAKIMRAIREYRREAA